MEVFSDALTNRFYDEYSLRLSVYGTKIQNHPLIDKATIYRGKYLIYIRIYHCPAYNTYAYPTLQTDATIIKCTNTIQKNPCGHSKHIYVIYIYARLPHYVYAALCTVRLIYMEIA